MQFRSQFGDKVLSILWNQPDPLAFYISGDLHPSASVLVAALPGNTGRELWMLMENYLPPLSFLIKCKKRAGFPGGILSFSFRTRKKKKKGRSMSFRSVHST